MNRWMFNALYMSTDTPEILDRLLTTGCRDDVNTACGERREVPLHLAAVIGSVRAIRSLLAAGADINARTVYDENALWLAAWQGRTEVSFVSVIRQIAIALHVKVHACTVHCRSTSYHASCKEVVELEFSKQTVDCMVVKPLRKAVKKCARF